MQLSEQAVLLLLVNVACAAWAAARLRSRRAKAAASGDSGGTSRRCPAQPGQRWRVAAVAWLIAALVGHVGRLLLSTGLAGGDETANGLPDGLSCLLACLQLVLLGTYASNQRLWLPAAPTACFLALDVGALVEAAQACRRSAQPQGGPAGCQRLQVAALVLAALNALSLAAATCCMLAATAGLGAGPREGEDAEPLLGAEAGRKRRRSRGSARLRLIQGTLRYLVPDRLDLKIRLLACFGLLVVGRVVNIALPVAYKKVIDRLAETSAAAAAEAAAAANAGGNGAAALCAALLRAAKPTFRDVFLPWVAVYLTLAFLQGTSGKGGIGFLGNLRDLFWIKLQQRASRRVSLDVFEHLLRLDHSFHLKRNTGKVMRILDRGTSSIQDVMQVVLFSLLPQLVDVLVACSYMALKLQPWTAVVVGCTVVTYIPMTFVVTEFRGKVRKQMNKLDTEKEGKATDMLLNYETVKLFGAERLELGAYGAAIDAFQGHEYLQLACISLLNIAQSALVFVGLALGLVVCVRGVVAGQLSVGDVVLFLSLMTQLMAPLTYFSSYYRQIQKGLIDMEQMFELLDTAPAVDDAPGAGQLAVAQGDVAFDRVSFGYSPDATPVLHNVSFSVAGGRTLALVGATGSGKSTILRLLLRFWDPTAGRVLVDGTDISRVTLASLRRHIAVVPQDCVLFNDSIRYNIRYSRPSASDEEVEAAARVAHIHDAIMQRFPAGYDTVVGERGLRLSGGEKQRVAFARAVLRRPSILVLDEATSALDSLTERMIGESLAALRQQQQCTTIIVAHRLSTVSNADAIVVMQGGTVAEAGTHAELLQRGGLYAGMWLRQQEGSFSQQAEAVAAAAAAAVAAAGVGPGGEPQEAGEAGQDGTNSPHSRHLSRTTSHTMTVDGREEDEEGEEEDYLEPLEGIAEGDERMQHR